jgi:hypothetical protein
MLARYALRGRDFGLSKTSRPASRTSDLLPLSIKVSFASHSDQSAEIPRHY